MVRVGIIGTGNIAGAHLRALRQIPAARIACHVDIDRARAEAAAAEFGGVVVDTLDEMWAQVDAVWVCTPPFLHAEQVIAAARAGKHVLTEKPMATSLAEANAMLAAARENGVLLMVGQVARYAAGVQRIHELLVHGDLGELVVAFSHRDSFADMTRHPAWRKDNRRAGGATLEWMIHEVDYVRWLGTAAGGPLTRIYAAVHYTDPASPHFDTLLRALLTFRGGTTGEVDGSLIAPLGGGIARGAIGTKAMAVTQGDTLVIQRTDGSPKEVIELQETSERQRLGTSPGILREDEAFIRAIEENRAPAIPGEEGRDSLLACLGILQSGRLGRALSPDEVQ